MAGLGVTVVGEHPLKIEPPACVVTPGRPVVGLSERMTLRRHGVRAEDEACGNGEDQQ